MPYGLDRGAFDRLGNREYTSSGARVEQNETTTYVVNRSLADNKQEIAIQNGDQAITEQRSGKGAAIKTAFRAVDDSRAHRLRTAKK